MTTPEDSTKDRVFANVIGYKGKAVKICNGCSVSQSERAACRVINHNMGKNSLRKNRAKEKAGYECFRIRGNQTNIEILREKWKENRIVWEI